MCSGFCWAGSKAGAKRKVMQSVQKNRSGFGIVCSPYCAKSARVCEDLSARPGRACEPNRASKSHSSDSTQALLHPNPLAPSGFVSLKPQHFIKVRMAGIEPKVFPDGDCRDQTV